MIKETKQKNSARAFISFDALFSILPIVFMVSFIIQMMSLTVSDAAYTMEKRENFNFLVATADYVVKTGSVMQGSTGQYITPNWIDTDFSEIEYEIYQGTGWDVAIDVGDEPPVDDATCIYRLVVVGGSRPEDGEIKKLYVCG